VTILPLAHHPQDAATDPGDLSGFPVSSSPVREFVLYRILGNDLPPRHRPGQTIDNLRFLLRHEPPLVGCEKRWVVNRIVDPAVEAELLAILAEAGQPVLRIPFDLEAYRRRRLALDRVPATHFIHSVAHRRLERADRLRIVERMLGARNRYAINNNGARNAALREGRELAAWVLPWDGNCFVTEDAWGAIRATARSDASLRYVVVPMARVVSNDCLLSPGFVPNPVEEPQVAFHREASASFDGRLRYGVGPKASLLRLIGAEGPWQDWTNAIQATIGAVPPPDRGRCRLGGWVARLASGNNQADTLLDERIRDRTEAVVAFLRRLDARALRGVWSPDQPLLYPPPPPGWPATEQDRRVRAALAAEAGRRVSVAGKAPTLRDELVGMSVLALAGRLLGGGRYHPPARRAARRVLDGLRGALPDGGHRPGLAGRSDWRAALCPGLDAIRMLIAAGVLDRGESAAFRNWAIDAYRAETRGADAERSLTSAGIAGTRYELRVLSLAAFAGEVEALAEGLDRMRMRIVQQFAADGSQPYMAPGASSLRRELANLLVWSEVAQAARALGVNLWRVAVRGAMPLSAGVRRLRDAAGRHAAGEGGIDRRDARLHALCVLARQTPPGAAADVLPEPVWDERRDRGLVPFWMLARH